jgi:hypothetical protein
MFSTASEWRLSLKKGVISIEHWVEKEIKKKGQERGREYLATGGCLDPKGENIRR